ncbi:ParA family protein, partial [Pseudomonas aeruginosa]|nr:ParA family protein [Pseudomonas aeruginosa]NQA90896.1 ParA family protein [Pseudomonas aeruginosa]NQB59671.1 ParA family protein [Pseudomonas aeruginosa]NQB78319.1 ParA family protein [Pseudomonas aeruginosa]NQC15799.1 ParA family protein [Pseudomonas aeruginosa]
GTLQLIEDIAPYRHLGIEPPPLRLLINRVHPVSSNARLVQQALRQVFQEQAGVQVLGTDVPAIEAYPRAATRGLPVHRVECRQPAGRTAPAALETMRALAGELFPAWQERFALVTGRGDAGGAGHGQRT